MNIDIDVPLTRTALKYWPEPYRAKMLVTIFLVENGGDPWHSYMNRKGLFVGYEDRGWCAINEAAIAEVRGFGGVRGRVWQDPGLFLDMDASVHMAHDIWQYRFDYAVRFLHLSYTNALIYAYCGWQVYVDMDEPEMAKRWALMRPRATLAMSLVQAQGS